MSFITLLLLNKVECDFTPFFNVPVVLSGLLLLLCNITLFNYILSKVHFKVQV